MQSNQFTKDAVDTYVKCFGFESVNNNALVQLVLIVETLISNILDNLFFVVNVYKRPMLTKKHMATVMNLMKQKVAQTGGSYTVLPSEYFGVSSGRYFSDVSQYETDMNQATVTRPAIEMQMPFKGGAKKAKKCMMSDTKFVEQMIEQYKANNGVQFTTSKDVVDLIMASININLDELLTAAKAMHLAKGTKKSELSMTLLNATIKQNAAFFKHLVAARKVTRKQ